jgi:hypothetical protein
MSACRNIIASAGTRCEEQAERLPPAGGRRSGVDLSAGAARAVGRESAAAASVR